MFDKTFTLGPLGDDSIRKMLSDVTTDKDYLEKLVYIAQGNPGAATAIRSLNAFDQSRAALALGICMAWEIKGPMLWLLFKDLNGQNPESTIEMIQSDEACEKLEGLHYSGYKRPQK